MKRKTGPDIDARQEPTPEYITSLVDQAKARHQITNQDEVARRIGLSKSQLKDYKSGRKTPNYRDQYALEAVAGHF